MSAQSTHSDHERERAKRRVVALSLALACLAPCLVRAQDAEPTDEAAVPEGALERDEAAAADATAVSDGAYEPDQRGEHDEAEQQSDAAGSHGALAVQECGAPSYEAREGLHLEVELWLGAALSGLEAAGGDNVVRPAQEGAAGGSFGVTIGGRFERLLVGPRIAVTVDPAFVLVNAALGADLELFSDALAPYVRVAIGPSFVELLGDVPPAQREASVLGLGVELGVGARLRAWRGLLIGVELAGSWHHLWRSAVPACTGSCTDAAGFDLRRGGESDALSLRISASLGYRF